MAITQAVMSTVCLFYQPEQMDAATKVAQRLRQLEVGCQPQCMEWQKPFHQKSLQRIAGQIADYQQSVALLVDKKGLWLSAHGLKVQPNWLAQQRRVVQAGKKSEMLIQATKLNAASTVIDATAGFGLDSIIMAGMGAQVQLVEQHPIMVVLLEDALRQIQSEPNWQGLASRLSIYCTDAISWLPMQRSDVVYLDPMFPYDGKQTAAVGKSMQILHHLASPPSLLDQQRLIDAARQASSRVIVKRPNHAPYLADQSPDEQWRGDAIRFDGYFS